MKIFNGRGSFHTNFSKEKCYNIKWVANFRNSHDLWIIICPQHRSVPQNSQSHSMGSAGPHCRLTTATCKLCVTSLIQFSVIYLPRRQEPHWNFVKINGVKTFSIAHEFSLFSLTCSSLTSHLWMSKLYLFLTPFFGWFNVLFSNIKRKPSIELPLQTHFQIPIFFSFSFFLRFIILNPPFYVLIKSLYYLNLEFEFYSHER